MTSASSKVSSKNGKARKAILSAIGAVLFGAIAYYLHFYFNTHSGGMGNILSYGAALILIVTLSSLCTAEFVKTLSNCKTAVYTIIAAFVAAAEVVPLPFCRQYFPMGNDFLSESYFIKSWVYTAIIIVIAVLLTVGINALRKKYSFKLTVEKK